MNICLNCQRQKCTFWAYEVCGCANFPGGLLHRRRRTGVEQLKLVVFHLMQRHFSDILIMWPSTMCPKTLWTTT